MQELSPALPNPTTGAVVYANPTAEQDGGGVQLIEIWRAIRRRQRLILVVGSSVFVALAANTLYKRITAPIYSGNFQLLISDPISSSGGAGGGMEGGGGVVESLARNRTSVDIPTLVQTLSSPLVLDPLRRQLGAAAAPLSSLAVSQAGSQGGLVPGVLEVKLLGRQPAEVQRSLDVLSQAYLQFALSQRRERLSQGLVFLDQQEPVLVAKVNALQVKLANFRRQHNLLSPETEAGALKGESMAMATQLRQVEAERIRLLKLRQDIVAGRLTAANFSTGASGQGDGVSVTQARSDLLDQLQSVEQQLAEARSVFRSDSPRVQNLVALRNRLAGQRRSQQLEAVGTALALNGTRSGTLNAQIQQIDRRFLKQPNLIKDYEECQQQLKVAQDNLASFLSTRATFQLEQAQNTLPWKLIAPPQVNGYPEEPSLRKGLLNGLMLGVVAGVGAGLLRDRLDHGFRNPREVKEELGEALLGHIPHVAFFQGVREDKRFLLQELDRSSSKQPSAESSSESSAESPASGAIGGSPEKPALSGYQRFFYQEAFRNLFTSIRFLSSDKPLRSLALTSTLPAEGKTLVNALLAKTLSEMGQRVLLVDADMRKPQLHHRLGLNNLTGLSNLLTEANLHWRDVLQPVQGYDNWSVITAGTRPPDTTRLLSSKRMHQLVTELAESNQFDIVLYDTPPVLGLADAPLVAQHVDGLILLVSLDRVDRNLPKEAISRVRSSGAQLLGVVTNALTEESEHFASYGYGNRYKYGYGSKKGYGYGYGVYDQRSSYSYYAGGDADSDAESTAETSPASFLGACRVKASKLRRRWLNWIDR
ncbi:polysaccharide biosynthesis tyrosine autokinase [Cyanobium sp. BA5m-10]|uniref:polysaccharide biosynthesis tyrosine autokinase n=1 Tax=Cyanobium sp. BA5m-10 TaxID=2823705 RepID=UPI0020CD15A0|nr:polysaccharide biosynthesis tyrosine autokinase [Cyanobium sp. BA5m-10]MCP9903219.1 polysaccharide biosynthesis tyrosine autokinase [Cyanobium sp. BA5m-10]